MGADSTAFFIEPGNCNACQLGFLTAVYGVILYQASGLIAEGSELLLLFPSVAGLVGSIVLPILGAVPDGVMVLFSGLGPDAQEEVSVGVGALAGSTVMLLTFPWFIAVMFGSVPIGPDGTAIYGSQAEKGTATSSGVTYQASLQKAAKIMVATTLLYLVIQLPATLEESKGEKIPDQASNENMYALVGLIACILSFIAYLHNCVQEANEDKALAAVIEGIKNHQITITAALMFAKTTSSSDISNQLLQKDEARLKKIVRPFFARFDEDKSGQLDVREFKQLLNELGHHAMGKTVEEKFEAQDKDKSGTLSFDEVTHFLYCFLKDELDHKQGLDTIKHIIPAYDEDDEEEEMPEDLSNLSPEEQLKRVLFRSIRMMGLGTMLVLIFSDPMVDILSEWGTRINVSPFYISFVLAPFASNASELLSAYTYAAKKSQKAITTALSTLVGAACMNNTFCLAIFLALIYCKSLAWTFTAETIAIILIQCVIGLMTIGTQTHTKLMSVFILLCYPGCLFVVWFLENVVGLD